MRDIFKSAQTFGHAWHSVRVGPIGKVLALSVDPSVFEFPLLAILIGVRSVISYVNPYWWQLAVGCHTQVLLARDYGFALALVVRAINLP